MGIPFSYNLRNLVVRKTTTLMTALGIALTVAVLVADVALMRGLRRVFETTGHPLHLLVLRKGSTSELTSAISPERYRELLFQPGVARNERHQPVASLEMVTVITLPGIGNAKGTNVTVRGLTARGIDMRKVRIDEGRWFRAGRREIVVGSTIARRHPKRYMSETFRFGKGTWQVVGVMTGEQSAFDNEVWGDLNQISSDFNRPERLSSVLIQAVDSAAVPALIRSFDEDRRLNVAAIPEQDYYNRQIAAGAPLQFLGMLVSIIMAAGSAFAAMNTMYAAVSRRGREIGTLRVLGFSRGSILLSFFIESLLLSLGGGVLGCLLALPLNHFETGIGNMSTFSEVAFELSVDAVAILAGIAFAVAMGAIGGLLPARAAAQREILDALREA